MVVESTRRTARRTGARLRSTVGASPLASFLGLVFAWSWGIWGALWLLVGPSNLNYLMTWPGLWGPLVAALTVTWLRGESVRAWIGRSLQWWVGARWYLVAVGGVFLLGTVSPLTQSVLAGVGLEPANPLNLLAITTVATFAGGSEEFGWRGFLHPRLRDRFDALAAGLAIGGIWAVWHLPLIWFGISFDGHFLVFAAAIVPISVGLGWLYDATGGSVLVVVLAHAAFDAPNVLTPAGPVPDVAASTGRIVTAGAYWVVIAGLVAVYGRRLSRGTDVRASPDAADP